MKLIALHLCLCVVISAIAAERVIITRENYGDLDTIIPRQNYRNLETIIPIRSFRDFDTTIPRRRIPSYSPGYRRARTDQCDIPKKEAIDALGELFSVGDKNILLPKSHCDIIEHCDNVQEKAKKKLQHLKCLKHGSAKLVFTAMAKGYLDENKKRCTDKEWREKFLDLSTCIRVSDAAADVHQCAYRLHDAFQYALNNIELEHQLQFSCCALRYMENCIRNSIARDCREDIADFAPGLFWEPASEAFKMSCPGIESLSQCRKMYPKEMKDIDRIFASTKRLSARNFMEPYYELLENRGSNTPEFVELTK